MIKLVRIILLALFMVPAFAFTLTDQRVEYVVDAIYLAEGGTKARYAYGIESVRYKNLAHARQLCRESVVNNYHRWIKAGKPGEFIPFMAKRYCPYNQQVWSKNVKFFLNKFDKQTK